MREITEKTQDLEQIKDYLEKIKQKTSPITILGLSDVAKSCTTSITYDTQKRPILLVTYNELIAQNLHKNIKAINPKAIYIPKKDIITYTYDAQSMDILYSRIEGIKALLNEEVEIAVVSTETIMQPILSKKKMMSSILKIMTANEYNIEEIKQNLVIVFIEENVEKIGGNAFSYCDKLLSVEIGNGTNVIEQSAFFDCVNLSQITIPNSLQHIKQYAFYSCKKLLTINYQGTIAEWEKIQKVNDWNYGTNNYKIYCTDGTIDKNGKVVDKYPNEPMPEPEPPELTKSY